MATAARKRPRPAAPGTAVPHEDVAEPLPLPLPTIDTLIITSPYEEPQRHWKYNADSRLFTCEPTRRPAGYVVATPGARPYNDPGTFVELPLVNRIRPRVAAWREAGYPGATGVTRRLLEHWRDVEEHNDRRFFFCQLEAIETLVWLTEAPVADRVGVDVPGDGGAFRRQCAKMATGAGKTVVMAMLVAWQILNKVANPQDTRFSKYVLVVAPGLTVKSRLSVLGLTAEPNYYAAFDIVPAGLREQLYQGRVLIRNWHALQWETEAQLAKKKGVDKRGAVSDEAYVRAVLGELASARNLLVINDEAHHAWRLPGDAEAGRQDGALAKARSLKGVSKEELEEATKWVGALDRIARARGILTCFDFSATPYAPVGGGVEEALFGWIVSDFGLSDAIEAGLVKTPRVVVRDDGTPVAKTYRSRLYHLYTDAVVRADLNRPAKEHEPLPDLVTNAYYLLGQDWLEAKRRWEAEGMAQPPVMISVANRTETAARIKRAFDRKHVAIDELCDPERTLHIDSKVLAQAEVAEPQPEERAAPDTGDEGVDEAGEDAAGAPLGTSRTTKAAQAELLRRTVDTIGIPGEPGEQIRHVISVGMLSEGWDAHTVTHIMGLRAFSSQLLCEQVVGRGLRRTSYEVDPATGLFQPEYVNIFGIPFTFLPFEGTEETVPRPPTPQIRVEPVPAKAQYAISWPNVLRVEHVYRPRLSLDPAGVAELRLSASDALLRADLAAVVGGHPDLAHLAGIELKDLGPQLRLQRLVFRAAADIYDQLQPDWPASREYLLAQLVAFVEAFLRSDRIVIRPATVQSDDLRRRLLLALNMSRIVQHLWSALRFENAEHLELVFDEARPVRSTGDMPAWYTSKPYAVAERSHVNLCVCDSTWEAKAAYELDHDSRVSSWAKNDHLGFEVTYLYNGARHKYRPDFFIRLASGKTLVLEVKGQDDEQNRTKRDFLGEWVRAVNAHGGFGEWGWDVLLDPDDLVSILARAGQQ